MLPGFVENIRKKNTNKKEEKDDVYLEDIYNKETQTANNYSNYGNRIYLSYIHPTPNSCDSECYVNCYNRCYIERKSIPYVPPPGWDCNSICTRRCCDWNLSTK